MNLHNQGFEPPMNELTRVSRSEYGASSLLRLARGNPGVTGSFSGARPRLDSIDLLRGIVMVIMTLDHTRDFFAAGGFNPRDVHEPALFLTRWITHFCAPVFVFLAGVSAFLYGSRGRSGREMSWFLLTRGLWLVILELTVVRFAWTFSVFPDFLIFQVIWVLGVAMITLSGLVHLPRWAIGGFGLGLILGHNLLDGINSDSFGALGWIWNFLHQPAMLHPSGDITAFALYPIIPWIGVMAAGYAFAPAFKFDQSNRRKMLLTTGVIVTLGFVALRATNLYGDPTSWSEQEGVFATLLSFINAEKYPPSLLYLAMTLGPALMALAAFDVVKGRIASLFVTIGRVPLAYYVAHIFLIHMLAVAFAAITIGKVDWMFGGLPMEAKPEGYGVGLSGVYLIWVGVVAVLYPFCRWFSGVKQRRRDWWLSYL